MTEGKPAAGSVADRIVDDLLPEELDWRRMVRGYPLSALTVAALGGFFLGRSHGTAILAALSSFAASEVSRNVSTLLGEDG